MFVNLTAATRAAVVAGGSSPGTAGLPVVFELTESASTQSGARIWPSVCGGCARPAIKLARVAVLRSLRSLGAKVIAEGVGDAMDLEALSAAGIGFVQGFAVGRPEHRPAPLCVGGPR